MKKSIRISLVVAFLGSVILWVGCGGGGGVSTPKWYVDIPSDPNYLYDPAMAQSKNMQFAVDKAGHEARVEIANQLETKVMGLFKQYREEVGDPENAEFNELATSVSKAIVSQVINGSKVSKQEIKQKDKLYEVYVLMEMPLGEVKAALMGKIKANQNMYTRFRASQGFNELEKEVEKYEQWKKEQGM